MAIETGCPACSSVEGDTFDSETFEIKHRGLSETVTGMEGWRCRSCGEVVLSPNSAVAYAATGDRLVEQWRYEVEKFLREIAIVRDVPAGNEICKQDPAGMLQTFIESARGLLGMPQWVEPREASELTKAVTAARIKERDHD